jgi:hypothetical protein
LRLSHIFLSTVIGTVGGLRRWDALKRTPTTFVAWLQLLTDALRWPV